MQTDQVRPMPDVVARLREEHRQVDEQLTVLACNAARFLAGDALEVGQMLEALRALHEYIDEVHAPREDLALDLVAVRFETRPELVEQIEAQHARIRRHGTRLLDHLERIVADEPVSRRDMEADLVAFVAEMRAHIGLEETGFFPLAERVLTAEDWAYVDAMRRR